MVSPPGLPVRVAALAVSAPSVVCDFSYVVALAAFETGYDLGDVLEEYRRTSSLHTRSPRRRMSNLHWAQTRTLHKLSVHFEIKTGHNNRAPNHCVNQNVQKQRGDSLQHALMSRLPTTGSKHCRAALDFSSTHAMAMFPLAKAS